MTNTFKISGDRGDAIASLPLVRAVGGGIYYIAAANYTRVRLTPDKWHGLDKLLLEQEYISDVREWKGERIDFNLDDFRATMVRSLKRNEGRDVAICDWCLRTFNQPTTWRDVPWLAVEPNKVARVVINRAGAGRPKHQQYVNPRFPWNKVVRKYAGESVFIGSKLEHELFEVVYGAIPYYETKDLLEAARVIDGAELFVGNQSCPLWISYGLGKRTLVEVWLEGQNSSLPRENVTLGLDENVKLPDL